MLVPVSREELIDAQKKDEVVGPVYRAVVAGSRPSRKSWDDLSNQSRVLMRSFRKLEIREGVLCRDTVNLKQIVLPKCYHEMVYAELHQKLGHVGVEKVFDLAQRRFYWPRMFADIKNFIQKKCRCVVNKQPNVKDKAPLHPIAAQYPFEMLSMDYIELDKCKGGYKYGLVVVDHFTRFCQFYATKTKSSQAAAAKIYNEFILQWGFPVRIHHDQGGEFNSKLFKELHRLSGIKSSNTTPYYPQGDGQCERLNRTLVNMLKTLSAREKADWKAHLPKLAYAVNSTRNKTTGYSPHYLMFGREAVLPIDQVFRGVGGASAELVTSHKKFVEDWESSMKLAFEIARKNIDKSATYNKTHYDKQAKAVALQVGDRVLVQNMREKRGKPKMRSFYEENIFKVIEARQDVPVYKIQNIKREKDVRIVHRNKLLKVDQLPTDVFEDKGKLQTPLKKRTKKAEMTVQEVEERSEHLDEKDSDDDEVAVVVVHRSDPAVVEIELGTENSVISEEVIEDAGCDSDEVDVDHSENETAAVESERQSESGTAEEDLNESTTSEEETPLIRKSTRKKIPRTVMSYSKLGGNPVREVVT